MTKPARRPARENAHQRGLIHLQRAVLMLPLIFAAPAFADPLNFYKSDAKAGELERARYSCMRQLRQPSGEEAVWLFIACMKAQGWHLIDRTAADASAVD